MAKFVKTISKSKTVHVPCPVVDQEGKDVVEMIAVRIRPLPYNFGDIMAERLTEPTPPMRPLLRADGAPVRENGRPVLHADEADEAYRNAVRIHQRRLGVATIVSGLDDSEFLSFDAKLPAAGAERKDWEKYYDAIYEELSAISFPMITFGALAKAIGATSKVGDESLREGAKAF